MDPNTHTPGIVEQDVVIDANGKTSSGKIRIQYYNREQRIARALKVWGICWGAALVAVFFPIVHFVLVPVLFLTGLIAPIFIYTRESKVLGGEGLCPECRSPLPLEGGSNEWPLSDLCSACRTNVVIQKVYT